MSSGKGTYWANELLDLLLAGQTFSAPGTTYVALYSVAPTASGGGTEATGSGYARVAVTSNTTNWPLASGGSISNGTNFTFPTATGNWSSSASLVAAAILDASSGGNLLYFGALSTAKPILSGDTPSFATGQILISET